MRIASWNINSLRLRLPLLRRLVESEQPDVICLQEIKVSDDLFPREAVTALGYPHVLHHGMKSYNGVAILSRLPLAAKDPELWCQKADCRHGVVHLPGGITLHNFYVPAGGDIPDPALNQKFRHKLDFLDEVAAYFRASPPERTIVTGDLNVAPLEHDVWSHRQLLNIVSHTPGEVERLNAWQKAGGFVDSARHFVPPEEKLYSWWSYRSPDWTRNDRGRRLDHIWVTPDLVPALAASKTLREMRAWEQPSDHVAVVTDLG
ncbi:MAG TPA: exodeoxyribonuclease III [Dongiaceae bacterium]|jgi:exodeoxyribonuclease-3|nr:exodeoxyribonuclease III [Dongiaceae bacterium]